MPLIPAWTLVYGPIWSTEPVPGQLGLYGETVSKQQQKVYPMHDSWSGKK